jgi:ArsR family transcriptional regulator, nickel/cobalt-responsive transcriptional repressor
MNAAQDAHRCAERLKLLADPTRLAILQLLRSGPRQVGELNAEIDIEQSLLSHHLRKLREARLVFAERAGKAVRYRLALPMGAAALDLGCCQLNFPPPARRPAQPG